MESLLTLTCNFTWGLPHENTAMISGCSLQKFCIESEKVLSIQFTAKYRIIAFLLQTWQPLWAHFASISSLVMESWTTFYWRIKNSNLEAIIEKSVYSQTYDYCVSASNLTTTLGPFASNLLWVKESWTISHWRIWRWYIRDYLD